MLSLQVVWAMTILLLVPVILPVPDLQLYGAGEAQIAIRLRRGYGMKGRGPCCFEAGQGVSLRGIVTAI